MIKEITDRLKKVVEKESKEYTRFVIYDDGSGGVYTSYEPKGCVVHWSKSDNPLEKIDEYLNEFKAGDYARYGHLKVTLLTKVDNDKWNFCYQETGLYGWDYEKHLKKL